MLECPAFSELRRNYLSRYYWQRPSMFKFVELIKTENNKLIKNLSIYLEKAFRLRKEILSG